MRERYSRQELFSGIGADGQRKLQKAEVVIIGAGALGSSAAETLVRAGVGSITIIDRDYVEFSNLNRQQLYTENDAAGTIPKAAAAEKRLREINSNITINAIIGEADIAFLETVTTCDLIIDALDNFETRMLVNDFCQKHNIPWIYGACIGSYGLTLTIRPGITPCLHCLMEDIPLDGETCDTAGIIAPAVQMVSAHQTTEAMKLLTGNLAALRPTLFSFDLWKNEFSEVNVNGLRNSECPSCSEKAVYPYLDYSHWTKTEMMCGREAVQIRPAANQVLSLQDLKKRYQSFVQKENDHLLVLLLENKKVVIFSDGRVMIHGVNDKTKARQLYQMYIGG
ncbi:ThiF family adenylyltransferase [Alteribacillus sp. HJP-4]|uniref:ThiF family adenylyltransferase n=1 Tax=Alteribacillus sp. HJP-4 TaxID=2775394 RepID=UPI0035CCE502